MIEAVRTFLEGKMRAYKVKVGGKEFTAFVGKVKY